MLAVYAPSTAAIVVTGFSEGAAGSRRLLGGFLRWRIGIQWYPAILVGIPMLSVVAILVNAAIAQTPPGIDHWYQLFSSDPPAIGSRMRREPADYGALCSSSWDPFSPIRDRSERIHRMRRFELPRHF